MHPTLRTLLCALWASLLLGVLAACNHEFGSGAKLPSETTATALETTRAQRAAAAVVAAERANDANLPSPAKPATAGALASAKANLPTPTPEQVAEAVKPVDLALAGRLDEAQRYWALAEHESAKLSAALADAKLALERERATQATAWAKREAEWVSRLEEEKARAKDIVLKDQVFYLNIAGGVFALGFGLSAAFGGLALVQRGAWVLLPLSLLAFGLAQIVGQAWFLWAVLSAVLLAVGVFAYIAVKNRSTAAAAQAFSPVLKTLDAAYDAAAPEVKALLDEKVFDPLSRLMDKAQKAAVHEARAQEASK